MSKLNFSCLIGSELGYLKVFNGYDWKFENQLNLKIGQISQIRKHNDEYYLSAENKIYHLKDLSEENNDLFYKPKTNVGNIIGFDFADEVIVASYYNTTHIIKNNDLVAEIGSGKFESFKLLRNGQFAIGGPNTEMHVYDINSYEKPVFVSKGEPNKALSLPAKVYITSIEQDLESDNILYCGTKYNTVQLYDIRSSQRKAQLTANFEQNRSVINLSALAPHKVIAASNGGCLGVIDFKCIHPKKKNLSEYVSNYAKFKGFLAGSITDCQVLKSVSFVNGQTKLNKDLLLTTSLDGHFSVYDIKSREMIKKVFMGKKPLCMFVDSTNQYKVGDLWDDLDNVEKTMSTKRKQITDTLSDNSVKKSRLL